MKESRILTREDLVDIYGPKISNSYYPNVDIDKEFPFYYSILPEYETWKIYTNEEIIHPMDAIKPAYLFSLLSLPDEDKKFRFNGYTSDEVIKQYVKNIDVTDDLITSNYRAFLHLASNGEMAFHVDHRFRGQGIGYNLVQAGIKLAKKRNYKAVSTYCAKDNTNVLKLLRKCGLKITLTRDTAIMEL